MFIRALLGSLLSVVAIVGPVSAATSAASTLVAQTGSSTITGQVTGDGKAIPQATVIIEGAGQHMTVSTKSDGSFTASVPPGVYTLTVNKGGYQTGSTEVTVSPGASSSVSVALTTASLNNLNVIGRTSATVNGNAARFNVTSTTVNSISTEQIRARNTPDLTNLVQELPGITIVQATSNPNQSFIIRGLRYETTVTLDGHPVSSGSLGTFITNYASSGIFGGVDVFKGGGLNGPITGESGVGIVNLRTPDFTAKDSGYFQAGLDNYGGSFYTAIADVNITPKLSLIAGRTFTGYRGPTYGLQEPGQSGATIPFYGSFGPPQNLTNGLVEYINDFSNTYSLNGELGKLRYKFSDATSLSVEYLGLQGKYDPQGGAYGQLVGYATIPQCVNGSTPGFGAACTDLSKYNTPAVAAAGLIGVPGTPLYAFYPGSDVRQNQPNFNADFKTTIGNDTLLFRPYTAAINRDIDGTQENGVPGDNGVWYQVTNPLYCQAQYVAASAANGGAKGPCFAGGVAPGAAYINPAAPQAGVVFATTSTPLNCSVAAPCYTTPTAINNGGLYGYGSPYTTLEVDNLFGYTFSYIHPVGANTYNLAFDHYYDNTSDYTGDTSPLAAGCVFTYGGGGTNSPGNAGPAGYQPTCPLATLRGTDINVPTTFDSRTSLSVTGQFALTNKLEFDVGAYYTKYLINGQQQNPATLTPTYVSTYLAGNASAAPLELTGTQNAGSHIDPRFGLLFRPTKDLAIRLNAGSSQEIPYASLVSGFKKYSLGAGTATISTPNFGLLPETIIQEDLGADYRFTKSGGVASFDLYNIVIHNPWISTSIPICNSLLTCNGLFPISTIATGYTSQTLNGAQQYAQGVEFSFNNEPKYGFGYRTNLAFERNYYLDTPPSYFGGSYQVFWNGNQFVSTGSGATSVPYAKGYGEVQYATPGYLLRFGTDYEGSNNEYNVPAFFTFNAGLKINLYKGVFASISGENVFNTTFGSLLARGVEYQGLAPVAAKPAVGGYTYSNSAFSTAAVSPGPETWRFSLVKQF